MLKPPYYQPPYDPTVRLGPQPPSDGPLDRINGTAFSPAGDPDTREAMRRWEYQVATGQIGGGPPKTDPKILRRHVRNELILCGRIY